MAACKLQPITLTEITEEFQLSIPVITKKENKEPYLQRLCRLTLKDLNEAIRHPTIRATFKCGPYQTVTHAMIHGKVVDITFKKQIVIYRISDGTYEADIFFDHNSYGLQRAEKLVNHCKQRGHWDLNPDTIRRESKRYTNRERQVLGGLLAHADTYVKTQQQTSAVGDYIRVVGKIKTFRGNVQLHAWEIVKIEEIDIAILDQHLKLIRLKP